MDQPSLQRKFVWPVLFRLAHWGIAVAVTGLLLTAWLLAWAPSVGAAASDYHFIFGALLMLALLLRLWLLVMDRTVGGWRALVPNRQSVDGAVAMVRFYLSFGASPLPGWYSHNPLWLPLYAMVLLLLAIMALSGYFMLDHPLFMGIYLPSLHRHIAPLIGGFAVAHVVAVVIHDGRGKLADVSGMLNGFRLFEIKPSVDAPMHQEHKVSLDALKAKTWKPGDDR